MDHEVVLTAVRQNGDAFEHASAEEKIHPEIVMAVVRHDGYELKHTFASDDSATKKKNFTPGKADQAVMIRAVKKGKSAPLFESEADFVKKDEERKGVIAEVKVAAASPKPLTIRERRERRKFAESNKVPLHLIQESLQVN